MMQMTNWGDSYVMDGLICWFDGINKGTDSGWLDLVGGILLTGDLVRTSYGFSLNSGMLTNTSAFLQYGINVTVEVAANITQNGYIFGCNGTYTNTDAINISTFNNMTYMSGGGADGLFNSGQWDIIGWKTASLNLNQGIFDMNQISKNGRDYWPLHQSGIAVPPKRYGTDRYALGEIYCVRIYNRQLRLSEVLHNQQVDNTRFNLGL